MQLFPALVVDVDAELDRVADGVAPPTDRQLDADWTTATTQETGLEVAVSRRRHLHRGDATVHRNRQSNSQANTFRYHARMFSIACTNIFDQGRVRVYDTVD